MGRLTEQQYEEYPGYDPELECPKCGEPMVLCESKKHDGVFYGCSNFPKCQSSHGAHPDGSPMGIPADEKTKQWRMACHIVADRLWKQYDEPRGKVYAMMASAMGVEDGEGIHISEFSEQDARQFLEAFTDYLIEYNLDR